MHELWTEYLKSFLQFFNVMLNIHFNGGDSMQAVTDVNVHERLGLAIRSRATKCFLKPIVHPVEKRQARNSTIFSGRVPVAEELGIPTFCIQVCSPRKGWL